MLTGDALQEALYSTLGDDPDLSELVEYFVAEVPQRKATLEASFASGDHELLQRTAHQIKGAAGSYGFDALTPAAAALEAAVRDGLPQADVERLLRELLALFDRLRPGVAP